MRAQELPMPVMQTKSLFVSAGHSHTDFGAEPTNTD